MKKKTEVVRVPTRAEVRNYRASLRKGGKMKPAQQHFDRRQLREILRQQADELIRKAVAAKNEKTTTKAIHSA